MFVESIFFDKLYWYILRIDSQSLIIAKASFPVAFVHFTLICKIIVQALTIMNVFLLSHYGYLHP